jgi:HEAT repeat protein
MVVGEIEIGFRLPKSCGAVSWAHGLLALLAFAIVLAPTRAMPNGWEHAAVPYSALIKALDFEQPGIRARAAQSLGFRGQREAVEPLVGRLAIPEEDPLVRSAIYTALGRLDDERAIPVLARCLSGEERPELRADCAAALGRLGVPATLPPLLDAFDRDVSILVRSRVVDALGEYSDERAVSTLAALVREDANRSLRQRAIRSLGRTQSKDAAAVLLAALAQASSERERMELVTALGRSGAPEASAPRAQRLEEADDAAMRTQIVVALGAIRDGSAYPTLIAHLDDLAPSVRYFAVAALRDLGRAEAAGPIASLSLGISDRLDRQSMAQVFDDPLRTLADLSLQEAALRALVELDPRSGEAAFARAARKWDLPRDSSMALRIANAVYQVRRIALYGLGYTASRQAAEILTGPWGLKDPDFRLRATAVRSLGVLGVPETVTGLLAALHDEAAEVRWTAATVLGRLEDGRAVEPLIERLADPSTETRKQAALSLGYLVAERAGPHLARLSETDADPGVRAAAAYAATLLGGAQ